MASRLRERPLPALSVFLLADTFSLCNFRKSIGLYLLFAKLSNALVNGFTVGVP